MALFFFFIVFKEKENFLQYANIYDVKRKNLIEFFLTELTLHTFFINHRFISHLPSEVKMLGNFQSSIILNDHKKLI